MARPEDLTVDYKKLLRLSVADRVDMARSPIGQSYLASLTPTQYNSLFPSYYKDSVPSYSAVSSGGGGGGGATAPSSGGGGGGGGGGGATAPSSGGGGGATTTPTTPTAVKPGWLQRLERDFPDKTSQESIKPATTRPGSLSTLAQQRRKFAEELKDPQLRQKLFDIAKNEQGENPDGTLAIMESAMNRAYLQGTTLKRQLRWTSEGGYYDDRRGRPTADKNNPIYQQNLETALGGSNRSKFATDNSSGDWGRGRIGYYGKSQKYQFPVPNEENVINGEQFTVPGTKGNFPRDKWQKWVKEIEEAEKSSSGPPTSAGKIQQKKPTVIFGEGLTNTGVPKNTQIANVRKRFGADVSSYGHTDVDGILKAIEQNKGSNVPVVLYSASAQHAAKVARAMKNAGMSLSNLHIVEPYFAKGGPTVSSVKDAISLGMPAGNLQVGPTPERGAGVIEGATQTSANVGHGDALSQGPGRFEVDDAGEGRLSPANKVGKLKFVDRTKEMETVNDGRKYGSIEKAQAYKYAGVHYTGGPTLSGALAAAKQKNEGYQYIIDKDGSVHVVQDPKTGRSNHWGGHGNEQNIHPDAKNTNSIGISFVGNGNKDVTPAQRKAGMELFSFVSKEYGIAPENFLGHGEVSSAGHRENDEGYALLEPWRQMNGITPESGKMPNIAPDAKGAIESWRKGNYNYDLNSLIEKEQTQQVGQAQGLPPGLDQGVVNYYNSMTDEAEKTKLLNILNSAPVDKINTYYREDAVSATPQAVREKSGELLAGKGHPEDQFGFTRGATEGVSDVDPRLVKITEEAAKTFPLRVRLFSGGRKSGRLSGGHSEGVAVDTQIFDENGIPISSHQTPQTANIYALWAEHQKRVQEKLYPELNNKITWGGAWRGMLKGGGAPTDAKGERLAGPADFMDMRIGYSKQESMAAYKFGKGWQKGYEYYTEGDFLGVGTDLNYERDIHKLQGFKLTEQQIQTQYGIATKWKLKSGLLGHEKLGPRKYPVEADDAAETALSPQAPTATVTAPVAPPPSVRFQDLDLGGAQRPNFTDAELEAINLTPGAAQKIADGIKKNPMARFATPSMIRSGVLDKAPDLKTFSTLDAGKQQEKLNELRQKAAQPAPTPDAPKTEQAPSAATPKNEQAPSAATPKNEQAPSAEPTKQGETPKAMATGGTFNIPPGEDIAGVNMKTGKTEFYANSRENFSQLKVDPATLVNNEVPSNAYAENTPQQQQQPQYVNMAQMTGSTAPPRAETGFMDVKEYSAPEKRHLAQTKYDPYRSGTGFNLT